MKLTKEKLKKMLSKRGAKLINDKVVDTLNAIEEQDGVDFSDSYRNNFVSYSKVLENPDYTMTAYIDAVKFVSYRLMDYTAIDAYKMAFPERYDRLLAKYTDLGNEDWIRSNKIAPYASIYSKGELVSSIMAQSVIPPSILNMDLFQQALNVEANLMNNARSETVRQLAAKTVLEILKPEGVQKIELDIGLKENDVISDLRQVTQKMAEQQRLAISSGASSSIDICEMNIIEAETDE